MTIDGQSEAADQRLEWNSRTLMLSGGFMTALSMIGITAVLPQIEAALAHSATDRMLVKLLVTIGGVTMVLGAPLAGVLVDRLGLRRVLVASCLIYSIAGTAGLYLNGLAALLASRLILGLTAAGIATMSMTLINTRLQGNDRAKWMGAHVSASLVGTLIVHPLLGLLGTHGWRWPFVVYLLGLPLAIVGLGIRHTRPARDELARDDGDSLFRWFPYRYAALAFVIGAITFTPMVYVPFLARATGVSSPVTLSFVLLADSVIGAIVSILFGRARKTISSELAFVFSFGCAGCGLAVTALAPNFVVVVVGMLLFGLGQGWFVPNLMTAWARDVRPDRQGRAIGLIKAAFYVAAPAGVVIVEPITRLFGPSGAMATLAALGLVAFALFVSRWTAMRGKRDIAADRPAVTVGR